MGLLSLKVIDRLARASRKPVDLIYLPSPGKYVNFDKNF